MKNYLKKVQRSRQRLGRTQHRHLRAENFYMLKTMATGSSEMPVQIYQITRRHMSEERNLNIHSRWRIKYPI